jgi:hypothetical protein
LICPSHFILCALMNPTISAPSINLSISMLFRSLHIFSILTSNILLKHVSQSFVLLHFKQDCFMYSV